VLRNASATGTLASGGTLAALQNLGQQTAANGWNQYVSNLAPYLNFAQGAVGNIGNLYSGLGTNLANTYGMLGQNSLNAYMGLGNRLRHPPRLHLRLPKARNNGLLSP
jgi:hypothetical protein